jgi:hypothetical protein
MPNHSQKIASILASAARGVPYGTLARKYGMKIDAIYAYTREAAKTAGAFDSTYFSHRRVDAENWAKGSSGFRPTPQTIFGNFSDVCTEAECVDWCDSKAKLSA